jgi:phage recombination protein Bet
MEENKNNPNLPSLIEYNDKTIQLIRESIMPAGATNNDLEYFIYNAKRTGLDPIIRQIYCIKQGNKLSIQATIDGFRLVAERSGKYQGQTPPQWCGDDGKWVDVWVSNKLPIAARVGIYRSDFKEPLIAVARFSTYAQKKADGSLQYNWNKMPDLMLSKCAEALALRKAFPQELSGLYTGDEYKEDDDKPETKAKEPKKETKPVIYDYPTFSNYIKICTTLENLKKVATNFEKNKDRFSESDYNKLVKEGNDKKAELEKLSKPEENAFNLLNQSVKTTVKSIFEKVTTDNPELKEDKAFIALYEKKKKEFGLIDVEDIAPEIPEINTGELYNRLVKSLKGCINKEMINSYYKDAKDDPDYPKLSESQIMAIDDTYRAELEKL